MRNSSTYRGAIRNRAREAMKELRAAGMKRSWRHAWASTRAYWREKQHGRHGE